MASSVFEYNSPTFADNKIPPPSHRFSLVLPEMSEQSANPSFWKLIRTRNFGLLWGAGGLSAIGDQFDLIAFPWLVLMVSGDPVAVGIVLAVGNIPTIFFILIGGSLADRYSPRVIMLTSNAIRIALVASLAVLVLTELADLWLIYVFALLKGVADSFYYPAQLALLPRVVPVQLLRQSNSAVRTTTQLGGFIGPALAGGLITFFSDGVSSAGGADKTGIGLAFTVVALALLVSSLMLLLMRMDDSGPRLAGEDTKELGIFSSIREGIQYVRVDGAMLAIFLLIVQMELLMRGPVTVGMPVLAHTRLTEGALALGIVTSAYAGGSVLGTVLAGALPAPKRGLGPILVAVFTLSGILMAPFGLLSATWLAAAITLTIGVMGGYVGIMIISWIQGRTPPAMLGRVMSLLLVASVAVSPISIAASGPLIKLSLEWVFIVAGALMAISSIVIGLVAPINKL